MTNQALGVALRAGLLRAPLPLGPTAALRQPDCYAPSTSLTRVAIGRHGMYRQFSRASLPAPRSLRSISIADSPHLTPPLWTRDRPLCSPHLFAFLHRVKVRCALHLDTATACPLHPTWRTGAAGRSVTFVSNGVGLTAGGSQRPTPPETNAGVVDEKLAHGARTEAHEKTN